MKDRFMKNDVFSLEYDKETLKDMVLELQEENEELKDRLKLIEEYYKESNIIKRIRFYWKFYKEKRRYANYRNSAKNDTN